MIKKAQPGAAVKAKPVVKKKKMQTPADFEPKSKFPRTPGGGDNYDETIKREKELKKKGMMKMGGAVKEDNSSFAKLAPPYDKATFADKIAGATQGKAKNGTKMKMGGKMAKQAAIAIAMKKAGKTPKKKMQYGGEAASMAPMMKKGGTMKKCKYGCK